MVIADRSGHAKCRSVLLTTVCHEANASEAQDHHDPSRCFRASPTALSSCSVLPERIASVCSHRMRNTCRPYRNRSSQYIQPYRPVGRPTCSRSSAAGRNGAANTREKIPQAPAAPMMYRDLPPSLRCDPRLIHCGAGLVEKQAPCFAGNCSICAIHTDDKVVQSFRPFKRGGISVQ
jgi:hypothetical protein